MPPAAYRPATVQEIETAILGQSPVNIYVYMKASKKYILYVAAAEEVSEEKKENLRRLTGHDLFVNAAEGDGKKPGSVSITGLPKIVIEGEPFQAEILSHQAGEALRDIYKKVLMEGQGDPGKISTVIATLADSVLAVVAPETENLKAHVLKNARNTQFMSDSAAITALGVMCSLANDFKSRTVFQNISQAALMMDASLADLEDWELETYYRNRKELPSHTLEKIRNHPVKSQQLVLKLPVANETVAQLILMHHELNNGKGYHRGIRTANSMALGKVLALAVDIYEQMRAGELNGQPRTLEQIVLGLEERGLDPHMRRHSAKFIKGLGDFLGITVKIS